jgi:hypothetical protein
MSYDDEKATPLEMLLLVAVVIIFWLALASELGWL